MDGTYHPNPFRRVEIPKENSRMRQLGIPTVVDRSLFYCRMPLFIVVCGIGGFLYYVTITILSQ